MKRSEVYAVATAAAAGVLLAYFLDRSKGPRRRAIRRDRLAIDKPQGDAGMWLAGDAAKPRSVDERSIDEV